MPRSPSGQAPSRVDETEGLAPRVLPSKRGLSSEGVSSKSTDLSLISNDVELGVLPQPVHSKVLERYKGSCSLPFSPPCFVCRLILTLLLSSEMSDIAPPNPDSWSRAVSNPGSSPNRSGPREEGVPAGAVSDVLELFLSAAPHSLLSPVTPAIRTTMVKSLVKKSAEMR